MHCLTVKILNNHKDEVVAIKDFKTGMVTMIGRLTNGQLSSSGSVQQSTSFFRRMAFVFLFLERDIINNTDYYHYAFSFHVCIVYAYIYIYVCVCVAVGLTLCHNRSFQKKTLCHHQNHYHHQLWLLLHHQPILPSSKTNL